MKLLKRIGAIVWAVCAAWRLPAAPGQTGALQGGVAWVLVAAAFIALFHMAFNVKDRRVNTAAFTLGGVLGAMLCVGTAIQPALAFPAYTAWQWVDFVFSWALISGVLGAVLALAYQGMLRLKARRDAAQPRAEGLLSKLLGNGFVMAGLMLVCWLPVWLAFWPGTFRYDAFTQFAQVIDGMPSAHHPLLHTLLLGGIMQWALNAGIDLAYGVAVYSAIQMVVMAAIIGYACYWLRKRGASVFSRAIVALVFALFPLFPLWSFSATKDVLFAGFALLMLLQLADFWCVEGALRSPWRWAGFILSALLMMLMRHNGVYAFAALAPFAVALAKNARVRMALLCAGCIGVYLLSNAGLMAATDAESGDRVEMLCIPLQQMARAAQQNPDSYTEADNEFMDELYPDAYNYEVYLPQNADAVKWAASYDFIDENTGELLSLWLKLGIRNPGPYAEAFLVQNIPYFCPGAPMISNIQLGCQQDELYPITVESKLPALKPAYEQYGGTLDFLSLPGVALLSSPAALVWLCLILLGWALICGSRGITLCCIFLIALWGTCLLGPIALMRYMLGFYYVIPVLAAAAVALPQYSGRM